MWPWANTYQGFFLLLRLGTDDITDSSTSVILNFNISSLSKIKWATADVWVLLRIFLAFKGKYYRESFPLNNEGLFMLNINVLNSLSNLLDCDYREQLITLKMENLNVLEVNFKAFL